MPLVGVVPAGGFLLCVFFCGVVGVTHPPPWCTPLRSYCLVTPAWGYFCAVFLGVCF